jgi:hypothetical protein
MCFRPPTAQKKMGPCPQCQTEKDTLAVCPKCGFVPEITCPKCGAKNLVTNEQCSQCGYKAPKALAPLGAPIPRAGLTPPAGPPGGLTPPKGPPVPPKVPPAPPKMPPMSPPAPKAKPE